MNCDQLDVRGRRETSVGTVSSVRGHKESDRPADIYKSAKITFTH